jgi:hypothetical protein
MAHTSGGGCQQARRGLTTDRLPTSHNATPTRPLPPHAIFSYSQTAPLSNTYVGAWPTAGFRQAATVDGSSFFLAGTASESWGFRYVASVNATTSSQFQGCSPNSFG